MIINFINNIIKNENKCMYKVAKLAPSSQVASKIGLTTFNSISSKRQNCKTKLF